MDSSSQAGSSNDLVIVITDTQGRYVKGEWKKVYLGLDKVDGIEIAWSITILTEETQKNLMNPEMLCAEGDLLNIIKCYDSWIIDDEQNKVMMCIDVCDADERPKAIDAHYMAPVVESKYGLIGYWIEERLKSGKLPVLLSKVRGPEDNIILFKSMGLSEISAADNYLKEQMLARSVSSTLYASSLRTEQRQNDPYRIPIRFYPSLEADISKWVYPIFRENSCDRDWFYFTLEVLRRAYEEFLLGYYSYDTNVTDDYEVVLWNNTEDLSTEDPWELIHGTLTDVDAFLLKDKKPS